MLPENAKKATNAKRVVNYNTKRQEECPGDAKKQKIQAPDNRAYVRTVIESTSVPGKGEKSKKCKKRDNILYTNAKRVCRGCKKKNGKMIMPSELSTRDYIVLC